ncbi:MAG: PAS domain S-box-containing protein [Porticoccaceae bacterium]|jgi:PAS domain S-box-containing protein
MTFAYAVVKFGLQITVVAGLYFVTALFGFKFATLPGNVSAIWIPSGIGLVALLTMGWRSVIGIWLGSFAINVFSLGTSIAVLLVSAAIATGSVVGLAITALSLIHFVLRPRSLDAGNNPFVTLIRSLACIVPSASIAAFVGVGSMSIAGIMPQSEVLVAYMTWWFGDMAGILIVGVILCGLPGCWARLVQTVQVSRNRPPALVGFALVLVGVGIVGWTIIAQQNREDFDQEIRDRANLISRQFMHTIESQLFFGKYLAAFFRSSGIVTSDTFSLFASHIIDAQESASTVSFLQRVPAAQQQAFEKKQRMDGATDFKIYERDSLGNKVKIKNRREYYPVTYIVPLKDNQSALGFDISSDPVRRIALEQARSSGQSIATDPVRLVQDEGQYSILLVNSIYLPAESPLSDEAIVTGEFIGYASTVIRLEPLLRQALAPLELHGIEIALTHGGYSSGMGLPVVFLSHNDSTVDFAEWQSRRYATVPIEFAGQEWRILVRPQVQRSWVYLAPLSAWLILGLGLSLGAALGMVANAQHRRELALAGEKAAMLIAANERTAKLDIIEEDEARMSLLLDSLRDHAIIMLDPEGYLVTWNAGAERMYGYLGEEIIGQHVSCFDPFAKAEPGPGIVNHDLQQAAKLGQFSFEAQRERKDGTVFWASVVISAVRESTGKLLGFAGVTRDITAKRETEHQLRESQKLEAVGQLTGGLAHDFNNLLGIVVGNLDEIHDFLPADNAVVLGQHTAAVNAALRGAEVARSLLAVARRQPLDLERRDLNILLEEMMPLMRSSAGSSVTLRCELTTDELITRLDPAGLDNAALNLVINARDAMQGVRGEQVLTLRTSSERVEATDGEELAPGSYAVLEVSDTGPGMSEAVRLQAFDAFFTTKERDKGTGLGLAMVYGYATQLGGTARIHSEEGVGTTVMLYLPLEQGSSQTAELAEVRQAPVIDDTAAPPSQLVVAKQTSVLVVDDEPELCALAAFWLASLDYVVTTANGPAEALECLASGEFDILFTDIVMPGGMDGIELSETAKRRQPELQVVLATGYAQRLLENNDMPGPVLDKPYRKADLAKIFCSLATS